MESVDEIKNALLGEEMFHYWELHTSIPYFRYTLIKKFIFDK